ncbi:MAG: ankyrin repeat domain-containing protein, partial [Alphaproteobacteria bacterium]
MIKKILAIIISMFMFSSVYAGETKNPLATFKYWKLNPSYEDVKQKIDAGYNIHETSKSTKSDSLIYASMMTKDTKIIQLLIDNGANIETRNEHGKTPLMITSMTGKNPDIIDVLIKNGADINAGSYGYNAIHLAAGSNKNPVVIEKLVKYGADVNKRTFEKKESPLSLAAKYGHEEVFKKLIELEADVYTIDGNGDNLWQRMKFQRVYPKDSYI